MTNGRDRDRAWFRGRQGRPRSPAEHTLTGAYRLLTVLLVLSIGAALLIPDNHLVQQFAPNAATEFLGIIVTLAFVQQILYRQERARRMRSSIGAYRRSGWALTRLVHVWAHTVKGCSRGELPRTLDRLFSPQSSEVIAHLDPGRVVHEDSTGWARRLTMETEAAITQLNAVVLSYSSVLDPAYTEAVDEIIDHPFVRVLADLTHADAAPQVWRTAMNRNRGYRDDFFRHIIDTVHLHNALAAEASTVRSGGRAPRTGTLGMELARDHDMHVTEEFTAAWRSSAPEPGSLRA